MDVTPGAPTGQQAYLRRMRRLRENVTGYLFIAPAVFFISVFGLFPVLFTIFVSLHKWRIRRGRFIGLANYREIFGNPLYFLIFTVAIAVLVAGVILALRFRPTGKPRPAKAARTGGGSGVPAEPVRRRGMSERAAWLAAGLILGTGGLVAVILVLPRIYAAGDAKMLDSLRVTIWYAVGTVPVQLVMGLILAVFLHQELPGKQLFRVIYLLPYIVPSVAAATVFERLFSLRTTSFANEVVQLFGGKPLQWLLEAKGVFSMLSGGRIPTEAAGATAAYWLTWAQGPSLALVSIMFFNWWVFIGYYALIYTNGLSTIPRQLYEAAEVDGAGKLTTFFRITIPLLSPTTYFLTLLGVIGTFKAFNHIYVLRNPAVRGAVDPMSVYIFFTFFRKQRFGYAAAVSLLLFIIVIGLTFLQRRLMERRVSYGS